MITLYTDATPNGRRVSVMLEETGLSYQVRRVRLSRGEHRQREYLRINRAGQIPAIVDSDGPAGMELVLTQTTAILVYLAEKTGRLTCTDPLERTRMWEWLALDATDIAPTRFDAFWLSVKGGDLMQRGVDILQDRVMKFYKLMDQRLGDNKYLAGETISIADISAYPWVISMNHTHMPKYQNLRRWMHVMGERPAVRLGMVVPESIKLNLSPKRV